MTSIPPHERFAQIVSAVEAFGIPDDAIRSITLDRYSAPRVWLGWADFRRVFAGYNAKRKPQGSVDIWLVEAGGIEWSSVADAPGAKPELVPVPE